MDLSKASIENKNCRLHIVGSRQGKENKDSRLYVVGSRLGKEEKFQPTTCNLLPTWNSRQHVGEN